MNNNNYIINSFSGFDKLVKVWLGDVYPTDFYYDFKPDVRHAFEEITYYTKEDLDQIQKILESLGVSVSRPKFTSNRDDYINQHNILLKPPIMPRDTDLVLGKKFYHLRMDYKVDPWHEEICEIKKNNDVIVAASGTDESCLSPPSITRIGKDIYVDYDSHKHVWSQVASIFLEWSKDYRVHIVKTGGHSDGVFCPIKPGLIVSSHWLTDYSTTFPDWEVFSLTKEHVKHFGKWYVDNNSILENPAFDDHINLYALDWIGNYQETQFSVNMLVIDDKTVLAVNENPRLIDFLDSKGINVIVANFRCKSFWDGGIHCLTCDIHRNGNNTDYFPERPLKNYLDWL